MDPIDPNKEEQLASLIASKFDLDIEPKTNKFREVLIAHVEHLLHKNPEKLSWILYRIDVNESYLKQELQENNEQPPAEIIADLIIERELQKINKGDVQSTSNWSFDI